MKYDDASWHYGGDFPPDLPNTAGANHIAVFLAWATLHGLGSASQLSESRKDLVRLKARTLSPVAWFASVYDEQFTDGDLNTEGNSFTRTYYGDIDGLHTEKGSFLDDYTRCFPGLPSLYHAPVDWICYDRIAPVLTRRLKAWRRRGWLMRLIGR